MKPARRIRTKARAIVDAMMRPYFDAVIAEIRHGHGPGETDIAEPASPTGVPSDVFHGMLHELRTIELERIRGSYERAVSVGASGSWYFEWFEGAVGPLVEHVGVEAFEPEPDDLPEYVTWRPTTADRFDGIESSSVDVVFAGQTSEHLWADELAGFLSQARRVLRPDGRLVLDSPNRLVTQWLDWSHGGHSVELSAGEITELAELAGFRVESLRGVWRCRFGDTVLGLEEGLGDGAQVVRRITDAALHPDDSFVWWLVARPDSTGDDDEVRERCRSLFAEHWPTRVCRGMWPGTGHPGPDVLPGEPVRLESLPFMLHDGRFQITIRPETGDLGSVTDASMELTLPGRHPVRHLGLAEAERSPGTITWEFDQSELMFALTLTVTIASSSPFRLAMPIGIEQVH
jgi:SAM-dependent methyltransferase